MKKTFALLLGIAVLSAALSVVGCKSRDVKKLALGLGPVPVPAVATCAAPVSRIFNVSYGCSSYIYDDTYGAAGPFTECDHSGNQKVYQLVVPSSNYLYIYAYSEDDYISISLRRNCNPGGNEADVLVCSWPYYNTTVEDYVAPGTYYLVIDSPYGPVEYAFYYCFGED